MFQNHQKSHLFLFFCVFVFLVFVMWCVPYSSDDYEFAKMKFEGLEDFLSYVLYYGNGRIFGNIMSISMVQLPQLSIVVKAFVVTSVIFLIPFVLKLNSIYSYLTSFILMIAINPILFGEVYTWTCGFCNYLPPIWLSLIIISLLQHYPEICSPYLKTLIMPVTVIMGIASQLFVEHSTIINIFLALLAVVRYHREGQDGKRRIVAYVWLIATLIGAVLMFLIPIVFFMEANRSTGYRSIHLDSIPVLIISCAKNTLKLANHFSGTTGIVVCLGAYVTVFLTRNNRKNTHNNVLYGICLASLIYLLFSRMLSLDTWYGEVSILYHLVSVAFVFLPFIVWILAALSFDDTKLRNHLLSILILSCLSLLVFMVVSPTPARVIFQSYVFIVVAFLMTVEIARAHAPQATIPYVKRLIGTSAFVLVLVLFLVFSSCRIIGEIREHHIVQQIRSGASTIEVCKIPYEYVFWDGTWCFGYYYYRDTPFDIQFLALDSNIWLQMYGP